MNNSILLFMNIGGPEMILIFVVVLLLFGGKKLPELARGLGKGLREFKDASDGIKREIHNNINTVTEAADLEKAAASKTENNYHDSGDNYHDTQNTYSAHTDGTYPDMDAPLAETNNTDTKSNEEVSSGYVNPDEAGFENTKIAH
jgi:sec-independent protein translocase protein TatA